MNWAEDPKLWILVAGMIGQAYLVHYRVGEQGRALVALRNDMDSLKEWRAGAREKFRRLEKEGEENE